MTGLIGYSEKSRKQGVLARFDLVFWRGRTERSGGISMRVNATRYHVTVILSWSMMYAVYVAMMICKS